MRGQDAVIDAIGGSTPYKTTLLESTSVRNMIDAMKAEGVRRLIVISMMGIGESRVQAPFWYQYLLMPTFLRGSTKDKIMMEKEVIQSGLNYIIARPPILKDDPPTGGATVIGTNITGHAITRADLANFLVGPRLISIAFYLPTQKRRMPLKNSSFEVAQLEISHP